MPTWEKRRSTVAEVAGHPRYWRAITLRLGNFFAFFSITPPPLSLLLFPEPTVVQVLFNDSSVVLLLLFLLTPSPTTLSNPYLTFPFAFGSPSAVDNFIHTHHL